MDTLVTAAVLISPIRFLLPNNKASRKPLEAPALRCLRKDGDADGLFKSPAKLGAEVRDDPEMSQETFPNVKNSNIWQLFREAQQNILYLNKQRLLAAEALDKANREKGLLLDRIEKFESENRVIIGRDKQSVFWELLLRVDSMVLTGMMNTAEASDLRKVIMDFKFSIAEAFFETIQKSDAELLAELRHFSAGSKKNGFHIVHICTEMAPLVSVGSVASYVTGLSKALQKRGHFIEVILPKYAFLDLAEVQSLRKIEAESYSYFNGQLHGNIIWTGVVHGIGVTFIEPLNYSSFFNRERVYGYSDDFERFTYFSRASLDYVAKSGKQPDVLHIHNWETALVGPLFWDIFVKQGLGTTRVLLTCHQLDSQCLAEPDKLALCGLDPARLHRSDRLQDDMKTHLINVLKGGVVYSNKVVIVSPITSKVKTICSFSHGLEATLTIHKDKLLATPYGIDDSTWDPSKDKFLPENYSSEDMKGKAACKVALQQHLALFQDSSTVLVGCILSEFMDFDLNHLKAVIQNATRNGAQVIILGSKMQTVNKFLESLQKQLKDEAVRIVNKYDEALSHLIFAGADIILCNSFHDPVHQVPLKALKYGAAPIVATVKGEKFRHLADPAQENTKLLQFINSSYGYMSLSQALDDIRNNPSKWGQKIADGMSKDFSWDAECCDIHVSAYTAIKNL